MTEIKTKISKLIDSDKVVLFMKGTPDFPQCGFSSTVVQILKHIGVNFQSYDVLQDEELREGIKYFDFVPFSGKTQETTTTMTKKLLLFAGGLLFSLVYECAQSTALIFKPVHPE